MAARVHWEQAGLAGQTVGDGLVTTKGTFQRFYRQDELRAWIDTTLGCSSVAAAPGIFYVFRERSDSERLLAERARRNTPIVVFGFLIFYLSDIALFSSLYSTL